MTKRTIRPVPTSAAGRELTEKDLTKRRTATELARQLTDVGGGEISVEMVKAHIAAGAPARRGRMALLDYVAWLARRVEDRAE